MANSSASTAVADGRSERADEQQLLLRLLAKEQVGPYGCMLAKEQVGPCMHAGCWPRSRWVHACGLVFCGREDGGMVCATAGVGCGVRGLTA